MGQLTLDRVYDSAYPHLAFVFGHETGPVIKRWSLIAINSPDIRQWFLRVSREAERDVAFRMFGDDWRNHVPAVYPDDPTPMEQSLIERAKELRPDLFA